MAAATEHTAPPMDAEKTAFTTDDVSSPTTLSKSIGSTLLKHSHDADAAMKAFEGLDGQVVELTEEKSRALLRKIDWHLMPVCMLTKSIPVLQLKLTKNRSCALYMA